MDKVTVVLLAVLIYLMYFRAERRLIVLVDVSGDPKQLVGLENIEDILKVDRDLGDHMHQDKPKAKWNYVVITGKQPSIEESLKYGNYLMEQSFIREFKIHQIESKPIEKTLKNSYIFAKGLYVHYISGDTLTKRDEDDKGGMEDFIADVCNEDALRNTQKSLIVNIIKYTPGNSDMAVYRNTVLTTYLPIAGARLAISGNPISDYWDMFAVIEYTRRNFCDLALSIEMKGLNEYKRRGTEDLVTLLTHQAIL